MKSDTEVAYLKPNIETQDDKDLMPTFHACKNIYTWAECNENLIINKSKLKKLIGILRRTYRQILQLGDTPNKKVLAFINANPNLYITLMYRVSTGQLLRKGGFDKDDVLTAMDIYCHQYERNEPIDPTIMLALYNAFKEYRDPERKPCRTLDHILKLQKSQNEGNDPFTVMPEIRQFANAMVFGEEVRTKIEAVERVQGIQEEEWFTANKERLDPSNQYIDYLEYEEFVADAEKPKVKQYDFFVNNFKVYKWDILNDILFETAILNKAPHKIDADARARIKQYWGVVLPDRLEIKEELIPEEDRAVVKEMVAQLG